MRIAYLGKIQLSDTDLPYLHEAQQLSDITYFMEVNPRFLTGPAFNIKEIYPKSGLFKAIDIYPEIKQLEGFIDLDKFYILNTCGKLWIIKSFWTNLILFIFLIRNKFDVIHLAWPPNIYEFVLYFLRTKMILTVHDPIPHTGHNSMIVRLRRKMAFYLLKRFILLNKAQRQEFLDYYQLSSEHVIEGHMSCCTYLQTVTPDLTNVGKANSYILFAGRISPYKGLDYLLPAMEKVYEQCPKCRLVIAGKGMFHFDISRFQALDYIDIRNRFIPDTELVALIKNCAFMVCPYIDATQSGVIMSAFAFNKPVIVTNVGGLPEMVKHNHYGLIIPKKDTSALAESILFLWNRPDIVALYAEEINHDYKSGEKSWKKAAEQLKEEYHKICN